MTNLEKMVNNAIGYVSLKDAKETQAVVVLTLGECNQVKCTAYGDLEDTAILLCKCYESLNSYLKTTIETLKQYQPESYQNFVERYGKEWANNVSIQCE